MGSGLFEPLLFSFRRRLVVATQAVRHAIKEALDRGADQSRDAKHKDGQNHRRDRLKQPSRSRHKELPMQGL
jgi:hypothetical protein